MFGRFRKKSEPEQSGRRYERELPNRDKVFSYHKTIVSDDKPEKSERISKAETKERNRKAGRLLTTVILIILIAGFLWFLRLGTQPSIKLLSNSYSSFFVKPTSTYQSAAHKLLASSLGNQNKLTINTSSVAEQLQNQFPEISNVSVTVPLFGHMPVVYLEPAEAALELNSQVSGPFLVSTAGEAILAINSNRSIAFDKLPQVTDNTGLVISVGHSAMSSSDAAFIQEVAAQLKAKHIDIKSMTLPQSTRELDVSIVGKPYIVKFNLQVGSAGAKQQIGTFLATWSYLEGHNLTPHQYIDVRVPGRVYYE